VGASDVWRSGKNRKEEIIMEKYDRVEANLILLRQEDRSRIADLIRIFEESIKQAASMIEEDPRAATEILLIVSNGLCEAIKDQRNVQENIFNTLLKGIKTERVLAQELIKLKRLKPTKAPPAN
jgi:hypothetical protein